MEDKHENKRNQNYISKGENWWGKNIQKDRKNLNKISKLCPLDIHRAYTQNSKIGSTLKHDISKSSKLVKSVHKRACYVVWDLTVAGWQLSHLEVSGGAFVHFWVVICILQMQSLFNWLSCYVTLDKLYFLSINFLFYDMWLII